MGYNSAEFHCDRLDSLEELDPQANDGQVDLLDVEDRHYT